MDLACPIPNARSYQDPEGSGSNNVLLLGEALGDAEAADHLPFRPHGMAGAVLDRAIRRCGFAREQFCIHNVCPVQPPKNWLEGAPWERDAIQWGLEILDRVIHDYKPRAILALGNVPLKATTGLVGPLRTISSVRGFVLNSSRYGIPIIPTFHPSFLRRGAMSLFSVLMHDLKLAVAVSAATDYISPRSGVCDEEGRHNALRNMRNVRGSNESRPQPRYGDDSRYAMQPVQLVAGGVRTQLDAHQTTRAQEVQGVGGAVPRQSCGALGEGYGRTVRFFSPVLSRDFTYTVRPIEPFDEPRIPLGYITHPSEAQAWDFYREVADDPRKLVAYDIETPRSAETSEDDTDELGESSIISIQFSARAGTGIFMPFRDPFVEVARRTLATPNPKAGANTWRFDDPLLAASGAPVNGIRHDIRWTWHHLQPDLRASLQFIASFYPRFDPMGASWACWKHLHNSFTHRAYYGIRDVDVIQEILCDR